MIFWTLMISCFIYMYLCYLCRLASVYHFNSFFMPSALYLTLFHEILQNLIIYPILGYWFNLLIWEQIQLFVFNFANSFMIAFLIIKRTPLFHTFWEEIALYWRVSEQIQSTKNKKLKKTGKNNEWTKALFQI